MHWWLERRSSAGAVAQSIVKLRKKYARGSFALKMHKL
jgi:hypothetical protein